MENIWYTNVILSTKHCLQGNVGNLSGYRFDRQSRSSYHQYRRLLCIKVSRDRFLHFDHISCLSTASIFLCCQHERYIHNTNVGNVIAKVPTEIIYD
jgi:hypothetical protein